jgi:hypothetical protein
MASAKSICEGQQKIDLSPFLVNNVLEWAIRKVQKV